MKIVDAIRSAIVKTIDVPDDLDEVTTYDPLTESPPEDAGMTGEDVREIWRHVEDLYRTGIYPGISFCLRRNGKRVLNRSIGHSHGNGPSDSKYAEKILITPDTKQRQPC